MDRTEITKHLYFKIPSLREMDVIVVLDMFLSEHKLLGVMTNTKLDTTDYDTTDKSLLLPSSIISVNDVLLNGLKIKRLRREDLYLSLDIGYSLGEDGVIYFNFDVLPDVLVPSDGYVADDIVVYAKKTSADIEDYEDKWKSICIRYCLKELYSSPSYRDVELYSLNRNEYINLKRSIGGLNRQGSKMSFMMEEL